ncbi:MAG: hypothetical protein LLG20_22670 [Acidobacteriales bacterium]|nr:hypothetical protein [Terriglobales bacterium]
MKARDVMPAALAALAFAAPEKPGLIRILGLDALDALAAAEQSGFLRPDGSATPQTGRLAARLASHSLAIAAFFSNSPTGEALAAAWRRHTAPPEAVPGIFHQAASLAAAVVAEAAAIATRKQPVSPPERHRRLAICMACDRLHHSPNQKPRCTVCRCFVTHKTTWRSQKCPKGKW